MTPIRYLLFILACVVAENSALEEINSALALNAAKDNPVLLKILQTVDAATSNERLFDVTLKILKSLCVCMRDTLRTKQLESYQLNQEIKSLQTGNAVRVDNKKVLDLYQRIYNKTCFDLREELAMKVNKSGDITPEEEFIEHSNCGEKAIEENTEDYEMLTSHVTQVAESETSLKKILHTTFVLTRNYHKFHMRKFNLFKKSQKSTQNSSKHSIIVILTFYPHHNGTYPGDNSTEVNSAELNRTLYSHSPIDIDVIDTRYGRKENSRDEDFIPKPATNCSLKSIYIFLLQSEQVNKTKVFKMLRKKGTIKVYIDIPTQINHIDYSKVCCSNETEIPLCKMDFSRESFDIHEITTYLPEFKKRKKLHRDYKDTISKIKTLVKLYDRKLNRNKWNQFNLQAIKNSIRNKFNNIVTSVEKNLQAAQINKDVKVILEKDKVLKATLRSKFNEAHPAEELVTSTPEKYILLNNTSSDESGMNTVFENTDLGETKELIQATLHDHQNNYTVQNENSQALNIIKLPNLTVSMEILTKTTTPVISGLEQSTDSKVTHENDKTSTLLQSYEKLRNSIDGDLRTVNHSDSNEAQETLAPLNNKEFGIAEIKTRFLENEINTTAETLAKDTLRSTANDLTKIFNGNSNISTNKIGYSDFNKILQISEPYSKQRNHINSLEELSIVSKNEQICTQETKRINDVRIDNVDITNTVPKHRSTNNKSQTKNHRLLRDEEPIKSTVDYSNAANTSNKSDLKPETRSYTIFGNILTTKQSIEITVDNDNDDLTPLAPDLVNNFTELQASKLNDIDTTTAHDGNRFFDSSTIPEISTLNFANNIEEKRIFPNKADRIKMYNKPTLTETYSSIEVNNLATTCTEKPSELFLSGTTDAVVNLQLSELELANSDIKSVDESDTFKTTDVLVTDMEKSWVNKIETIDHVTKNNDVTSFNVVYPKKVIIDTTDIAKKTLDDRVSETFNSESSSYTETNTFEAVSPAIINQNDVTLFGTANLLNKTVVNSTTTSDDNKIIDSEKDEYTNKMVYQLLTATDAVTTTIISNLQGSEWVETNNLNVTNDVLQLKDASETPYLHQLDENVTITTWLNKTTKKDTEEYDSFSKTDLKLIESHDFLNITETVSASNDCSILFYPYKASSNNAKAIDNSNEPITSVSITGYERKELVSSNKAPPVTAFAEIKNIVEEKTIKEELSKSLKLSNHFYNTTRDIIEIENSNPSIYYSVKYGKSDNYEMEEKGSKSDNSFDKPILKTSKSEPSKQQSSVDNEEEYHGLTHSYSKIKKAKKDFERSAFENNAKTPKAEYVSKVFEKKLRITTEPYLNHINYRQNTDDTLGNKKDYFVDEKKYNSGLIKTWTPAKFFKSEDELDESEIKSNPKCTVLPNSEKSEVNSLPLLEKPNKMENNYEITLLKLTENDHNHNKISGDLTEAAAQYKFRTSRQPHDSTDSFAIIRGFKSSQEFSDYFRNEEYNVKNHINILNAQVLSDDEQLLTHTLKKPARVISFSVDKTENASNEHTKNPKLVRNGFSVFKQQGKPDSVSSTNSKLNNTAKSSTEIVPTNNIGSEQREINIISISDIEQHFSKSNKSRITRSTSATNKSKSTYNQISTFSTTVPFRENLVSNFSALQDLDESIITKAPELPEISNKFEFPLGRTESELSVTVDSSFDNTQTEVMIPRTEKDQSISVYDKTITTYIISPNFVQDTYIGDINMKKSMAELNNLTNFEALNATGDEDDVVENINVIQETSMDVQAYIEKPHKVTIAEPQQTKYINNIEDNYFETDKSVKGQTDSRNTINSGLKIKSLKNKTHVMKAIPSKTSHNTNYKETTIVEAPKRTDNISNTQRGPAVTETNYVISLELRPDETQTEKLNFREPATFNKTQLMQSLQLIDVSDNKNKSRSMSFDRTDNETDLEVQSSLEDINNDFQKILNFLNESITENINNNTIVSVHRDEHVNGTLKLTIENTSNIKINDLSMVTEVFDKFDTETNITDKHFKISRHPNFEETQAGTFFTSATQGIFDQLEQLTSPVSSNWSVVSFRNTKTGDDYDYTKPIIMEKINISVPSSFINKNDYNEHNFSYTKTSNFGGQNYFNEGNHMRVTTPQFTEMGYNSGIIRVSNVTYGFMKENISFTDGVTSRVETKEKISKSTTKSDKIIKSVLNRTKQAEHFELKHYNTSTNNMEIIGPSKDFTSFKITNSINSAKDNYYDKKHIPKVTITNKANEKKNDEAGKVAVIMPLMSVTENNSALQNITPTVSNDQLPLSYNSRVEGSKENIEMYKTVTKRNVKIDDKFEINKGIFKSVSDFDNFATLKPIGPKQFQEKLDAQSNNLHYMRYNFIRERSEFITPTESLISFQLTDLHSSTEANSDIITNISKPSTMSNRQYSKNQNEIKITEISSNSLESTPEKKETNKTALNDKVTDNRFKTRNEKRNNEIRTLSVVTFGNEDEKEISNEYFKKQLITNLMHNDFKPTEKFNNIVTRHDKFKESLKITEESNFNTASTDEVLETELVTLGNSQNYVQDRQFLSSTADKHVDITVFSNSFTTLNYSKNDTEETSNLVVTEFPLNVVTLDSETYSYNKTASIYLVSNKNDSSIFEIENTVTNYILTLNNLTLDYLVKDRRHDSFFKDTFGSVDFNSTEKLNAPLSTAVFNNSNANPNIVDNIENLKEGDFYLTTTKKLSRTDQFISPNNGTGLKTLTQTPNYDESTDDLNYTKSEFEHYDVISTIEKASIVTQQLQAYQFDVLAALTEPLSDTTEFHMETLNTSSKSSSDGVKHMNETYSTTKDTTNSNDILTASNVTLSYLTDNEFQETNSKELFDTDFVKSKTKKALESIELLNNMNAKAAIFDNYLETTEEPSFETTQMGEILRTKSQMPSINPTDFTIASESQYVFETTDSSNSIKIEHDVNKIPSSNQKTSTFSVSNLALVNNNLTVLRPYSLEYQNETENSNKGTLRGQDEYVTDNLIKTEETTISNDVAFSNMPENKILEVPTKFDLNINSYESQSHSQPNKEIINYSSFAAIPLEITTKSNYDKTQTEATTQKIKTEDHDSLGRITKSSTAESEIFVNGNKSQGYHSNLITRIIEETSDFNNPVTVEEKNEKFANIREMDKAHKYTIIQNIAKTISSDINTHFDDKLGSTEVTSQIGTNLISHNESANIMDEKQIHEEFSNSLFTTGLSNDFDDRPNFIESYITTTTKHSIDRKQTDKHHSFQSGTESTSPTEISKSFSNTTFIERKANFTNDDTVSLLKNEYVKRTLNRAKTSSLLNSNYSYKLYYAVTESLFDSEKYYAVSSETSKDMTDHIMFTKEQSEKSNRVTFIDTTVDNVVKNEIHSTHSIAPFHNEVEEVETLQEVALPKINYKIDSQLIMIDQQMVTEDPSNETHKVESLKYSPREIFNLFELSPKLTAFNRANTVDYSNNLETTRVVNKVVSKGNTSELNLEKTYDLINHTYQPFNTKENFTNAQHTSSDMWKTSNGHLSETSNIAIKYSEINGIVTSSDIETDSVLYVANSSNHFDDKSGIIVEYNKRTERPVSKEVQTVEIINTEDQHLLRPETDLITHNEIEHSVLITNHLGSTKNNITNALNFVTESDTSMNSDGNQKTNTTVSNDADAEVDGKNRKESIELITDMLAIIETATGAYKHFKDDFNFLDTTNFHKTTDVKLSSKSQTGLGVQFTITGVKSSEDTENYEIIKTAVSPFESNQLQNQTIEMDNSSEVIAHFKVSEKPKGKEYDTQIPSESLTEIDQKHIVTTSESLSTEKDVVNRQTHGTFHIITRPTATESMTIYQYESNNIFNTNETSNLIEISKTSSEHPGHFDISYSKTDTKLTPEVHVIEETNVTSDNIVMTESTTSTEKRTTNIHEAETSEEPENKIKVSEDLIVNATENATLERNINTTISNSRIIELLGKIRSSYNNYQELDDTSDLMEVTEKYNFTKITKLSETGSHLTDTKILRDIEPKNIYDAAEIDHTTEHEHYAVTGIDFINQLQSKQSNNFENPQQNEINLEKKNIFRDAEINTTESNTQIPLRTVMTNNGDRFRDNQTDIQDYTHSVSKNMSNISTADNLRTFLPNKNYIPNLNEYFTFDQTRTEINGSYDNVEMTNSILESPIAQDSYIPVTKRLSVQTKTVSQKTFTPYLNFNQEKNLLTNLDTVFIKTSNESKVTEHDEHSREREVTQLIPTYTEHNGEGQLQSSENNNEFVTKIDSNSITLAPSTTPINFSLDDVSTNDNEKMTARSKNTKECFVTSPTLVLSVKGNLTVPSHIETLEDTENVENEVKVPIIKERIDSFSTLSMINENVITKRNAPMNFGGTKPNNIDELTLPNGNKFSMDRSILVHVPPLAFQVNDLKFELEPKYNDNNIRQTNPKLHGNFNISLNVDVTDSMNHIKTLEVVNKANVFENKLYLTKAGENSIFGSPFDTSALELETDYEKKHGKMTENYASLLINKKEFLSSTVSDHNKAIEVLNKANAFEYQLYPSKEELNSNFRSHLEKSLSNLITNERESLSTNFTNTSELQTIKYYTQKNGSLWDVSKNISIKKSEEGDKFTTPEVEKYTNAVQYTVTDTEHQEDTSLLLEFNTDIKSQLITASPWPDQNSVPDPSTFDTNLTKINISEDTSKSHMTTINYIQADSNEMTIYNISNFNFQNDKTGTINLARSAGIPTTPENVESERRKNDNQTFNSRRHYGETEYIILSPNKDAEITENKLIDNNKSGHFGMNKNNYITSKVKSDFNVTNINTVRSNYTENDFLNSTSVIIIDGIKTSNNIVPAISEPLYNINTITNTKNGNLEQVKINQNMTLIHEPNVQNPANYEKVSRTTTNANSDLNLVISESLSNTEKIKEKGKLQELPSTNQNIAPFTKTDMQTKNTNSNAVPVISETLHSVETITNTEKGSLLELTTTYQNVALLPKTNTSNSGDDKKGSEITTNTSINIVSTISESFYNFETTKISKEGNLLKPFNETNLQKSADDRKGFGITTNTSGNLVPTISTLLRKATTAKITEKENLLELVKMYQNATSFNKINVPNLANGKNGSTNTTTNSLQLSGSKLYTVTDKFMIVHTINDNNSNKKYDSKKTVTNKTIEVLEVATTDKRQSLGIQDVKLKNKVEKTPSSVNKSNTLISIRKVYGAISLLESAASAITNQKTNTLTTVNLNVVHTPEFQNNGIKDKKIMELNKQQNRKSSFAESVNVNNENNKCNKSTVTVKTAQNPDSNIKYEALTSNQQGHVTSRSLFKTIKQIKYNTYRPLTEEELDPSEIHKIISSFPKYDTKKVKTKNPQQVKNYHETPYGNKRKYETKHDVHNKSSIYDPLDKKNFYPVKKLITPRKVIKRLKIANKRNDIMTMNTNDFFSRRLGVKQKDKINDILKLYPKPVLKLQPVTSKPTSVLLRPKFSSFNTLTKKPSIIKPVIVQNMDIDYYRGLNPPQYRRSGPIWSNIMNKVPGNLEVPLRTGFGDPVIDTPYYIPTIMKPKFLRDRVNSIRSYIYNAENKPNYRRHFMNDPDDVDDGNDSHVQYSKGNSWDEEDTDMPLYRFTRQKKTIFFLSPTVPYNRYF